VSAERTVRVAVVGATELVGAEVVSLLDERAFPVGELRLYGSPEFEGDELEFRGAKIRIEKLDAIPKVDLAFLCATAEAGETLGVTLAAAGAVTIDMSLNAPGDASAPLVLGVGDIATTDWRRSGGILVRMADPLSRLAAVPLRALGALAKLERVIGTFLVPASAFGRERVNRLGEQTIRLLNLREAEGEAPSPEIAFRCIPDRSSSVASTSNRIAAELARLLGGRPQVVARVVEVPVFYGQAVSLAVELQSTVGADEVRAALRETPSLLLVEGDERLSTLEVVGTDGVFIIDLRREVGDAERWLSFWALGDNVRQGAALPAVAMAESLLGSRGSSPG
jgi:aspartate-semialdehyde dehydrogenase